MKVYEALAKAFKAEGTTAVFGMMGSNTLDWIDTLAKIGVPTYEVRHEGAGLGMAETHSIMTGEPGVCTTTSGPGVTQLSTTMVVASRSRTPLVAFCGDTKWGDQEDPQRFDIAKFADAVECAFVRVTKPEHVYDATQRAFYTARSESRPVILSAPMDVQRATIDDDEEYVVSKTLLSPYPLYPNPDATDDATEIIANSTRPVIVVGRGAVLSGAAEAVCTLASRIGAIVATSVMALNWPPQEEFHAGVSGLFATRTAMELFQQADCVIGVGASLNHYTIEHGYLYPNAKVIHLDTRQEVIMGDGRLADCFVRCDARVGLEVLEQKLADRSFQNVGFRTAEVKDKFSTALFDPVEFKLEEGTVDPREAFRALDEEIPEEMGMVICGSHSAHMALMLLRKRRPFTITNKNFGSMSKGIAAVIGVTMATREPTALVEGDIGFMMHIGEFDTAVRYNLPIFVAIMNDQAMGTELHQMARHKEVDSNLARVTTPDLGKVGVALGGRGHLVRTIEELRSAVSEFVADPAPTLIDVRISSNVDSIQTRRLQGDDTV